MVILPRENHLEEINRENEDSSSETSDEDSTSEQDNSTSIIQKISDNKNALSIQENTIAKFIPGNSHINVENSNDVVIGSLTQFHGPVTIVQNGTSKRILGLENGSYITADDQKDIDTLNLSPTSDPVAQQNGQPQSTNNQLSGSSFISHYNPIEQFWTSKRRCLVILAAITVPLLVIALSTSLTLNHSHTSPMIDITDDDTATQKPLGKHLQITRGRWGGRPMLNNTIKLKHPVGYVIISHTAGNWCKDFRTCSDAVQILQSQHVSTLGSPDIGYNFLIGGDANIYVGRGWNIRNFHTDNNIGISFIGNFVYDSLTDEMIDACQQLLEEGVKTGKLATNYTLIAHNQTYPTQSPGDHIFAVIKKWPHFISGDFLTL